MPYHCTARKYKITIIKLISGGQKHCNPLISHKPRFRSMNLMLYFDNILKYYANL